MSTGLKEKIFLRRLENPAQEEKISESAETTDHSRANTPSTNLDTMERFTLTALDSEQEEAILEDKRMHSEIHDGEERENNYNSRVTFLLT